MTVKEKMIAGEDYFANDPSLLVDVFRCKTLCQQYNALPVADVAARRAVLQSVLGTCPPETCIAQPFYCDYGSQIHVGRNFVAGPYLTILDEGEVRIGDDVYIGPNVSLYTACHSTIPAERNTFHVWTRPITIGDHCVIEGSCTLLPGATIPPHTRIPFGTVVLP